MAAVEIPVGEAAIDLMVGGGGELAPQILPHDSLSRLKEFDPER
jgi:hypothetical protein